MTAAKSIKILGALVLLASITLPMATCTRYVDSTGELIGVTTIKSEGIPEGAKEVAIPTYALDHVALDSPILWVILAAFVWPVLALITLQWKRSGRVALVVRGLEPLLLIGSLYVVEVISTFMQDHRSIGAYLAFAALALYAIGTLWSDVTLYINWKNQRHT